MSVQSNISEALGLGASATTDADYGQQGALRDILAQTSGSAANADKAIALANQLVPQAEEADPWAAAFKFFAEMGKQASKPGATVLGSAVSSMSVPFDYLQAKKAERNQTEQARLKTALSLGPSLKSPAGKGRGTPVKVVKDDGSIGLAYPDDVIKNNLKIYVAGNAGDAKRMDVVLKGAVNDATTPNIDERIVTILESEFDSSKHVSMSSYTPTKVNTTIEALEKRAAAGGLVKDTAEYNAFILNGGKVETGSPSVEALKERAELAGLTKDSEAYKEFMITGGKTPTGFSLKSDGDGNFEFVQGEITAERTSKPVKGYIDIKREDGTTISEYVPGSTAAIEVETQKIEFSEDVSRANFLLKTVEAIIGRPEGNGQTGLPQNPYLESVVGSLEGKVPMSMILNQGKIDVLVDIDFLKDNAFMEAFQSLKGGGQITEKEGKAATAALAKLTRLQSSPKFIESLTEFANIIRRGREKAKTLTSKLPSPAGSIYGGEDVILDFDAMSQDQIKLIDVKSLTSKQRLALAKKLGI